MLMTMAWLLTARVNLPTAIVSSTIKGDNYYYNDKGEKVTGFQEVDGKVLYFDAEGKQVLGRFVTVDNYTYYLDPKTGERYTNRSVLIDGKLYTFDKDGHVVS